MKSRSAGDKKTIIIFLFLTLSVLFFPAACDQFSLSDAISAPPLSVSPQSVVVSVESEMQFSGSGGTPPYTYGVSGTGNIDSEGWYGAPATLGTATVTLIDSKGKTASANVTIVAASGGGLAINPSVASLTRGASITFIASGGTGPYTFSLTGDGYLDNPASGLYYASTTNPTGSATVTVTDSAAPPAQASASVLIGPLPVPVSISPLGQVVMVGAEIDFDYAGGAPPYVFSVDRTAYIDLSGAYTASKTAGTDTIVVTDGLGMTATSTVTVFAAPPLVITPTAIKINAGSLYPFSAAGGAGGNVFSVIGSGTIDALGVYTAPAVGGGTATVRVTDKVDVFDEAAVEYVAAGSPLAISPAAPEVPENGTLHFVASGGITTYTFGTSDGTIVPDGTYPETAIFSPTAVSVGVGAATITVTDSDLPIPASVQTTVTVYPAAPTNLTATDMTGKVIRLTWQDNSNGEAGFIIQWKEGHLGTYANITIGSNTVTYNHTGLSPNKLYVYRIKATSLTTRDSDYSNEASAVVTN